MTLAGCTCSQPDLPNAMISELPAKTEWGAGLLQALQNASLKAGFDAFGVAPAAGGERGQHFADWVDAGRAGEMEWLKRRDSQGVLLRSGVQVALPWARSVVVCAMNYHSDAPRSIDPASSGAGWIGRYSWSGRRKDGELVATDYHDDLMLRLRRLEAELKQRTPCETRCYVDTGPLIERDVAASAGIGWVGKNTCILREGVGSWMLLGVMVTSLSLSADEPLPTLAADRCGSCTRCLDACPTNALVAPRQMDASLCIAYLTIEKKGEIAEELQGAMGRQVFGCDICQEVCPWNSRAPIARKPDTETRMQLVNPSLAELAKLDSAGFRRLFKRSPLERTGRKRLHRNVAIAMGNSGNVDFIPQLEAWANGNDPVLASTATRALVRLEGGPERTERGDHQALC